MAAQRCDSAARRIGAGLAIALSGACCLSLPRTAAAGSFSAGELSGDYKLTLNYGLAIRMENQSQALINGPIDLFQLNPSQISSGNGFTHTGLPTTVNGDDGDRNFNKYSLISNRVSALLETEFTYENFGAIISGDGFYDLVYHQSNDNNSPDTINKLPPVNEFTDGARYYDGQRVRLLDAYVYGDWSFSNGSLLDVRIGKQLVAWGESLFFSGVSSAQSTADATKAFVPGSEVKQILLPTNQISASLAVTDLLTVKGYYKLDFKPNEIFPVGDYFSTTDSVGPGAAYSYGAINPLYLDGCPGLLGPYSNLCNLNGIGGKLFGAPPYILIPRHDDQKPSSFGQYGLALRYQLTSLTSVGLYWLRYNDPNPSVAQHSGYPVVATHPMLTTKAFNEPTADYYYVKYFDGIDMMAASYSTVIGPINVAGELSYRRHASVPVQAVELGTYDPVFSRGSLLQALTSAIYAANPHLWFNDLALVGEVGYIHVTHVNDAQSQPGIAVVGTGDTLFYDRNSWGLQALAIPTKHNVVGAWDLSLPITFGWLVKGNPSMPGAFGPLAGAGDLRFSLGAGVQYLQNLEIGVSYSFFFGDPEKNIGQSFVKQNPYVDRDYLSINVKYSL